MKSFVQSWAIVALAACAIAGTATQSLAGVVAVDLNTSSTTDATTMTVDFYYLANPQVTLGGPNGNVNAQLQAGNGAGLILFSRMGLNEFTSVTLAKDTVIDGSLSWTPNDTSFSLPQTDVYIGVRFHAAGAYDDNSLSGYLYGWLQFSASTAPYILFGNAAVQSEANVAILAGGGDASAVPEIDPATGSSALSLVAGVLAMVEQRRRRGLKAGLAG